MARKDEVGRLRGPLGEEKIVCTPSLPFLDSTPPASLSPVLPCLHPCCPAFSSRPFITSSCYPERPCSMLPRTITVATRPLSHPMVDLPPFPFTSLPIPYTPSFHVSAATELCLARHFFLHWLYAGYLSFLLFLFCLVRVMSSYMQIQSCTSHS
ncbi:hypothetical protein DFH06DRAFT_578118 [Mycena polygramma]|nr:hypothetical protein DFH06DRAFT_578118 [Mycena polygramma]